MKKPVKKAVTPPAPSRPAEAPICAACRYWVGQELGRPMVCKRYPPIPLAGAGQVRPTPLATDTCGEFKAKA